MSILSDVHVTYNEIKDDFAYTRFRFKYGYLHCNTHKKAKKKLDENAAGKKEIHGEKYSSPSTDELIEHTESENDTENDVSFLNHAEINREINLGRKSEFERQSTDGDNENICLTNPVKKDPVNSELIEVGDNLKTSNKEHTTEYDSDGDMQIKRKRDHSDSDSDNDKNNCLHITIKHRLATELDAVGEQVWHGALLLCDFICTERSKFKGQCVVDLGSGTGLTSIIAAMFADHVFCTDTGDNVLSLASSNINNTTDYLKYHHPHCPVEVKELNWFIDYSDYGSMQSTSVFAPTTKDLTCIKEANVLIAADVIYDDDITDAFFSTVKHLMSSPPGKTLYIGLEKRMVFTIQFLEVSSPGYNYFKHHLQRLVNSNLTASVQYSVQQIPTDFSQYFQYTRTDYLELWKITSTASGT